MEQSFQEHQEQFSSLLKSYGSIGYEKRRLLESLLEKYPYCQPLHVLYALALKNEGEKFNDYLPVAAVVIPKREVLFRVVNNLENPGEENYDLNYIDNNRTESNVQSETEELVIDDVNEIVVSEDEVDEIAQSNAGITESAEETQFLAEEILEDEEEDHPSQILTDVAEQEIPGERQEETAEEEAESISEISVFEATTEASTHGDPRNEVETIIPEAEFPFLFEKESENQNVHLTEDSGTEKAENQAKTEPIFDSIAAADYFVFDQSAADPLKQKTESAFPEAVEEEVAVSAGKESPEHKTESKDLSKYNDDKMPFTFLWWLHKTRKEYSDTYQPYVSFHPVPLKPGKTQGQEELNHQIIENIFHLQVPLPPDAIDESSYSADNPVVNKKEEDLIERFIKEEPQIRPPKSEKLDTENKARKSSEDNFDLVSETLAQIYIEQMLYHKAIDTYKKLSLKFPEKSTYFAGQIIELEKKIS
ncbi:hypothetical protein [Rubrolithibacter danxiaensis]|uniref:hypothetical protein n=1 Tax=Rubrolithibacter danxiaensis TaxID=3390805 RepID=UPI003BF7E5FD